jgi:hypothetical protein
MKKLPFTFLLIVIILILFVGGLILKLSMLNKSQEISEKEPDLYSTVMINPINVNNSNPIHKLVDNEKLGILYTIRGRFTQDFKKIPNKPIDIYQAKFIIKGDPKQREIPVEIMRNAVSLGVYDNSFEGKSFWDNNISFEEILTKIKTEEEVEIKTMVYFPEDNDPQVIRSTNLQQKRLDLLIEDFNKGTTTYNFPADFNIFINYIGIVEK